LDKINYFLIFYQWAELRILSIDLLRRKSSTKYFTFLYKKIRSPDFKMIQLHVIRSFQIYAIYLKFNIKNVFISHCMQFIKIKSISCENIIQIFKIFIMLMNFLHDCRGILIYMHYGGFSEEKCKYIFNNIF
jgi:hypothetical protein